jgi:hypothetical protein
MGALVSCTIEQEENYRTTALRTRMKLRGDGIVRIREKEIWLGTGF